MLIHEFIYGDTPCLVQIKTAAAVGRFYEADLYVLEKGGQTLRQIGDQDRRPVRMLATNEEDAVVAAAKYLEARFGPVRRTREPASGDARVRTIHEPPLKDDRSGA